MAYRYENTHQWITFDVSRILREHPRLWVLLGECQSKCEHIAGVPLRPDVADKLHQLYLAKGTLATTAIEGNTLSEEEVLKVLNGTLKLPPSREYLKQEIDNILAAYQRIWSHLGDGTLPKLSVEEFQTLNQEVLKGLSLEESVVPGKIRNYEVGVSRYRGAPPEDCKYLLARLSEWIDGPNFMTMPPGMKIIEATLKAIMAHLYVAWIHPFGDGNGRTARLVEYRILLAAGVPSPAVHLLSNHYNLTRTEYYRNLDRTSASGGDYIPFIEYAVQGFVDGLKQQITEIRDFQLEVIWRNYVHELFGDKKTDVDRRRRNLILSLSDHPEPVAFAKIPTLTPKLATDYSGKTRLVLNRDLNILRAMGLIERTTKGNRARREIVEAFLPFRYDYEGKKESRQKDGPQF